MRRASFSPSLHQLFSLSVLTGYRLTDWVRLFGFSLDTGVRFQAAWPCNRTVELDSHIYHPEAEIPWFEEAPSVALGSDLSPLNRWLSGRKLVSLQELARPKSGFRYFKIGSDDAYAYPDLLPGSIVRVNPRIDMKTLLGETVRDRILAIEHSSGVTCSHARLNNVGKIILCSKQLPYTPAELTLGTQARILGVVDLEIRRLAFSAAPTVSSRNAQQWPLEALDRSEPCFGEYLRRARLRSNLSFKAASERIREVARALLHANYFCSPSFLSDIEASGRFPRHIHKLISLSALYCVSALELAARAGLPVGTAGKEAMPLGLNGSIREGMRTDSGSNFPFLRAVEDRFEEIPFFLHNALLSLTGLPYPSVRDIFWAGATADLTHPYLRDAVFLAVNRKSKQPAPLLSSPLWAQPLYVIELRNGHRLCATCSLHGETLLIRPCTAIRGTPLRLRNHADAEVLGRVVALVRSIRNAAAF